jgi:hypothetical protein
VRSSILPFCLQAQEFLAEKLQTFDVLYLWQALLAYFMGRFSFVLHKSAASDKKQL